MARFGALVAAAALLALGSANVGAASGVMGYDGSMPFACELQQLGTGTEFPHPDADPFCVEYDKRHQNVTELGVVDFLSQEPARVAVAGPKCWYFQRDHWVGSIVQDDGATQTYKWDGSYFFDKARGLGGVFIENFTVNGQTGDPRDLPGFPEEWKPYFGPGKGGVMTSDTVRADPRCVAAAKTAPAPGPYRCTEQRGKVGMGIGPLRLGIARRDAEAALGPAGRETHGVARWCTADGGKLSAGFASDRLRFVLTTSPGFSVGGLSPGEASAGARKRLRKFDQRGGVAVLVASSKKRLVLVGADRKRIRFIAVLARGTPKAATRAWLDASR
ncbi:MAG: hypothetical protein QOJ29_3919 [Thermoleophilaceae bacterium]|nr:hypothetical protein [Thermoleophilaceae bacterium]